MTQKPNANELATKAVKDQLGDLLYANMILGAQLAEMQGVVQEQSTELNRLRQANVELEAKLPKGEPSK